MNAKAIKVRSTLKKLYGCNEEVYANAYRPKTLRVYKSSGTTLYIPFNLNDFYLYIFRNGGINKNYKNYYIYTYNLNYKK